MFTKALDFLLQLGMGHTLFLLHLVRQGQGSLRENVVRFRQAFYSLVSRCKLLLESLIGSTSVYDCLSRFGQLPLTT